VLNDFRLRQRTAGARSKSFFDDIDRPEVAYTVPEILEPAKFKQLLAAAEEEVPEMILFLLWRVSLTFAAVNWSENTPRTRSWDTIPGDAQ
jgi:hypothetical protein